MLGSVEIMWWMLTEGHGSWPACEFTTVQDCEAEWEGGLGMIHNPQTIHEWFIRLINWNFWWFSYDFLGMVETRMIHEWRNWQVLEPLQATPIPCHCAFSVPVWRQHTVKRWEARKTRQFWDFESHKKIKFPGVFGQSWLGKKWCDDYTACLEVTVIDDCLQGTHPCKYVYFTCQIASGCR